LLNAFYKAISAVLFRIASPVLFSLPSMKSIVVSSMLAVIGCVALSLAVAMLAGSPGLQDDGIRTSSPPAATHARTAG
jgi:hypothetical protein